MSTPDFNTTRPSTHDGNQHAQSKDGNNKFIVTETASNGKQAAPKAVLRNITVVKRSNKHIQALHLPVIANINPRSIYNKIQEFKTFVEQEDIDIVFMSESWEREEKTLHEVIKMEDHEIISNVYQRNCKGGRPALIVNNKKFSVQNLTNTVLNIKWGVEVVWCLLTPKNTTHSSKIQKIACASIYCKPGSKHKTELNDHIAEAFNVLSTKYSRGLHFILAGDTNELDLTPILNISSKLAQIVRKPTRVDPVTGVKKILDPVITTLEAFYQTPQCLPPLDADPDSNGKPSDHRIVTVRPVSAINTHCARSTRQISVRPISEPGLDKMRKWLQSEEWSHVYESESAHVKAEILQQMLLSKFHEFFPKKTYKISSDDQPWINHKIKTMDRKRKREYTKHRKSDKWQALNKTLKENVTSAKNNFYKKMVSDVMSKNTSQWYSCVKRMTSHDQEKYQEVHIQEISELSDEQKAEKLGEFFSKIPNEYDQIKKDDIDIPPIKNSEIPQFKPVQAWMLLSNLKINKSTVKGDIPAKLYKEFAAFIAEPLSHVYNAILMQGEYPRIYKFETCTPVPKKYPVEKMENMVSLSKSVAT